MLRMWTDFARFGDPNGDPGVRGSGGGQQVVWNTGQTLVLHLYIQVVWNPGQTMVFGVSGKITGQQEWRDRWGKEGAMGVSRPYDD